MPYGLNSLTDLRRAADFQFFSFFLAVRSGLTMFKLFTCWKVNYLKKNLFDLSSYLLRLISSLEVNLLHKVSTYLKGFDTYCQTSLQRGIKITYIYFSAHKPSLLPHWSKMMSTHLYQIHKPLMVAQGYRKALYNMTLICFAI